MQVLYDAGFDDIESDRPRRDDLQLLRSVGLARPRARQRRRHGRRDGRRHLEHQLPGVDRLRVQPLQQQRHQLPPDATPTAASDHDPEIVGINAAGQRREDADPRHQRLPRPHQPQPGGCRRPAPRCWPARSTSFRDLPGYEGTVFAAAGDLIGASTFESFILNDKPTIDALNAAGLDVSSVGNHEFDQGYDDLVNRVMAPYDIDDNPDRRGRVEVPRRQRPVQGRPTTRRSRRAGSRTSATSRSDSSARSPSTCRSWSPRVASPTSRSPTSSRRPTARPTSSRPRVPTSSSCWSTRARPPRRWPRPIDPTSDFGKIVNGVNANVDAIISGHTHLAYNHRIPVPAWQGQGRTVTRRPVVSSGQYGYNLNRLNFRINTDTGQLVGISQSIVPLQSGDATWTANFPADPEVTQIVADANAEADVLGNQQLGQIGGAFNRARTSTNAENRGGESTLGNLVAEVQRWATPDTVGGAQIAFMNPGGLRQDMQGVRHRTVPARPDLPPGCGGPAVRQHPGEHGPHGCPDQGDAGAAVAARWLVAAVPAAGCVGRASPTPTTRPRPPAPGSRTCGSTGRRSTWARRTP